MVLDSRSLNQDVFIDVMKGLGDWFLPSSLTAAIYFYVKGLHAKQAWSAEVGARERSGTQWMSTKHKLNLE